VPSNELHTGWSLMENLRRRECLHCGSEKMTPCFAIEQEMKPPSEYWHTIVVQCIECRSGQLERAYYDSTDGGETLDQTEWFLLDQDSMAQLTRFIHQHPGELIRGTLPPCAEPLSPKCLCNVHWQLTEAAKRLEPLNDDERRQLQSAALATFACAKDGFPTFERALREEE